MLSYVLKNGNVTVYQWQHGEPPDQNQTETRVNGCELDESAIDWGEGPEGVVSQDDGIDFGEIDFGEGAEEEVVITLEESGVGGVVLEGEGQGGVVESRATQEKKEYSGEDIFYCFFSK